MTWYAVVRISEEKQRPKRRAEEKEKDREKERKEEAKKTRTPEKLTISEKI